MNKHILVKVESLEFNFIYKGNPNIFQELFCHT